MKMAVNSVIKNKPKNIRPVSETRKIRKPLMERKRRERINNSLEQLAVLLKDAKLVAADKPVAKIEKADILELTVQHLMDFKLRLASGKLEKKKEDITLSNEDGIRTVLSKSPQNKEFDSHYLDGFSECFNEVQKNFESIQGFEDVKHKLMSHLESRMTNLASDDNKSVAESKGSKRQLNEDISNNKSSNKKRKLKECKNVLVNNNENSNNNNSSLTLVPMRMSDGNMAFILQGDTQIINDCSQNVENKKIESAQKSKISIKKKSDLPKSSVKPFIINPSSKLTDNKSVDKVSLNNQSSNLCGQISYSVSIQPNQDKTYSKIKTVTLPVENPSELNEQNTSQSTTTNYIHILAKPTPTHTNNSVRLVSKECLPFNYENVLHTNNQHNYINPPISNHNKVNIYPPSPPPSAPLADMCPISPPQLPDASVSNSCNNNFTSQSHVFDTRNAPDNYLPDTYRTTSLLSSSVNLLNSPQYYKKNYLEDEEFIDVENFNDKLDVDCDDAMWRPW